ncbi:hypothetical protein KIN20_006982 [Parelaphostrongylus tenuis]|uniref:Uncharacterized protein n=1 Tax=Parelaphostrongylus tenuis TaxID=148309 RepID=A0AAD5QGH2_PARTN|nr:hypothetical protein KIN20_006982 [Parelaphostrongylus tenuis]
MPGQDNKHTKEGSRPGKTGNASNRPKKHMFRGGRRRFAGEFMYPTGGTKEDPLNLNAVISGDDSFSTKELELAGTEPLEISASCRELCSPQGKVCIFE